MDITRTPYTRYAFLDQEHRYRVLLRWYPAPAGARPFPGRHLFSSGDWNEQGEHFLWPGPGEDKDASRDFYPGNGPRDHYTGQGPPVGDLEWFRSGVPAEVIEAALRNPPPMPPCYRP